MSWKNLKYWQKTGVIFGVGHLIFILLLLFTKIGSGEGGVFLAILLEWPLVLLTGDYLPPVFKDNIFFVYSYLIVLGTLSYTVIGIILGMFLSLISFVFMKTVSMLTKKEENL